MTIDISKDFAVDNPFMIYATHYATVVNVDTGSDLVTFELLDPIKFAIFKENGSETGIYHESDWSMEEGIVSGNDGTSQISCTVADANLYSLGEKITLKQPSYRNLLLEDEGDYDFLLEDDFKLLLE